MQTINLSDHITFDKKTSNFTFEMSDVPEFVPEKKFMLHRPKTGKNIIFEQTKIDTDGGGEDIYGYCYKSVYGSRFPCTLLAIND